jgi:hypothetical protein
MPDNLGLPLLAHRQTEWYFEAFFFELMSAYDTLLQELNIVYAYDLGLKTEHVRWDNKKSNIFMAKIPETIKQVMIEERGKEWFYKVEGFGNMATHHYTVPFASGTTGVGEQPIDWTVCDVSIIYFDDKTDNLIIDINVCKEYLRYMVKHISSIWQQMAHEFK